MILVLGSTGFIGRHVTELLSKKYPGEVRALVRKAKSASVEHIRQLPGVEVVEGDILDTASLKKAMQGVETVLDFAQVTANFKNTNNLYHKVNVEGTRNVVAAAESAGVKLLILGSGLGTVEGKPGSYMRTRWEAEEAVRKSKLNWVIFQPSILFGSGAEFFDAQARLIKMLPIATIIGNGKTRFQPIAVTDVARTIAETISRPDKIGKHIPIGGPQIFTYKELITLMVQNLNKKRLRFYLPLPLAKINAALFNLLPKPPLTPATLELFGFENITNDLNVVEKEFGFKPVSLVEYLKTHTLG